jgi:hypothetical protein
LHPYEFIDNEWLGFLIAYHTPLFFCSCYSQVLIWHLFPPCTIYRNFIMISCQTWYLMIICAQQFSSALHWSLELFGFGISWTCDPHESLYIILFFFFFFWSYISSFQSSSFQNMLKDPELQMLGLVPNVWMVASCHGNCS